MLEALGAVVPSADERTDFEALFQQSENGFRTSAPCSGSHQDAFLLRHWRGIFTPYYRLRERNGQKTFEVFLTSAASNTQPPDSLFQRPPGPERREPRRRKR